MQTTNIATKRYKVPFSLKTRLSCIVFLMSILSYSLFSQQIPSGDWLQTDYDAMGNYYLTDNEKLIKWDSQKQNHITYKNSFYGDIYQIDCYRGLTNMVFHKETAVIVLLDNTLSIIGNPLELNNGGHYQIGAACLSDNNQLWIADMQTMQLLLIDRNMNTVAQAAVFGQYTSATEIQKMVYRNGQIIMYTSDNEIITFDRFGTFSGRHTFTSLRNPLVKNNDTYFFDSNSLLKFNHATHQIDTIKTTIDKNTILLQSKNGLYLLSRNKLTQLNQ